MNCLIIKGLNLDIFWKNKKANFRKIEQEFENTEADIYLLPEMFATGFCMDANEIADEQNETLLWMQTFAKQKNAAVCGSVSVKEGDCFFNRMFFVKPDASYQFYDKRHLFSFSGEDKIYTAGKTKEIVEYKGFRILLQVCYDLRFPVFSRNQKDYDIALYVANWPQKRVEAWQHLLKARAIENQSYVFGLNRIGTDGNQLHYQESSHCFFADGKEVSEKKGNIVTAKIEMDLLRKFQSKFQFLNDADGFQLML